MRIDGEADLVCWAKEPVGSRVLAMQHNNCSVIVGLDRHLTETVLKTYSR